MCNRSYYLSGSVILSCTVLLVHLTLSPYLYCRVVVLFVAYQHVGTRTIIHTVIPPVYELCREDVTGSKPDTDGTFLSKYEVLLHGVWRVASMS